MSRLLRRWTSALILQSLVWALLLVLAVALPFTRYGMAVQHEHGMVEAEAKALAYQIGQRVAANPQLWAFETHRLAEALRHSTQHDNHGERRAVIDAQGQTVAASEQTDAPQGPLVTHREPLHDQGKVVGWVVVEHSLHEHLQEALFLGLLSCTVFGALAWLLTRLPLRRLRDMEDALAHKAYHDDLTGLYNREAFRRLLGEAVAMAARDRLRLAVLYIDLDRFKSINDTLGHDAGDEALRAVADRLRQAVRSGDIVARLSGDEFAILMEAGAQESMPLAQALVQRFETPFAIGGRQWHLGASVGLALYPDHATAADRLLACADTAMLAAKSQGRGGSLVFSDTMEDTLLRRVQAEDELRGALERDEFRLHYQPLVRLSDDGVAGAEALLRWQHPRRGLVPPVEFIGVLEESGLIHGVGQWVLDEACRQMRRWLDEGLPIEQVSVNVSALQFARQDEFVDGVRHALREAGLPAHHLQLELTEGTLMTHSAQSLRTLEALRQLGVQLAIDDFGTGYSSLAYLRSFPVSVLKVDRSFVRDMQVSEANASIVRAVIQMAHSMRLKVTAEGVETLGQRKALQVLGCDTGQGYGLGRPMPAAQLAEWLQVHAAQPALD